MDSRRFCHLPESDFRASYRVQSEDKGDSGFWGDPPQTLLTAA